MLLFERRTPDMETEEYLIGKRILAFSVDSVIVGTLSTAPALISGAVDAAVGGLLMANFYNARLGVARRRGGVGLDSSLLHRSICCLGDGQQ